jgi:hypothetical protein
MNSVQHVSESETRIQEKKILCNFSPKITLPEGLNVRNKLFPFHVIVWKAIKVTVFGLGKFSVNKVQIVDENFVCSPLKGTLFGDLEYE